MYYLRESLKDSLIYVIKNYSTATVSTTSMLSSLGIPSGVFLLFWVRSSLVISM